MGKLTCKPETILFPLPAVMVSCGTVEKPNVMTAAWTGTVCSRPVMTYVSITPERHSHGIIKDAGDYVINLTTEKLVRETDYCGVTSGRDVNKFEELGLTAAAATKVASPLIAECPVNIECRVERVITLGSHDMFIAKVVAVNVDESLADRSGAIDLSKAGLLAYTYGRYYSLGTELGSYGYSIKDK